MTLSKGHANGFKHISSSVEKRRLRAQPKEVTSAGESKNSSSSGGKWAYSLRAAKTRGTFELELMHHHLLGSKS